MRLTTFTDYSLRLLMYLAAAPEHRATIGEVASAFGISEHHLVKVVHTLGKEGFLVNTRGKGGGMRLARPPSEIRIGAVVRSTEQDRPAECFDRDRDTCAITGVCRLPRVLHQAVKAFYEVLDEYTLEDLRIQPAKLAGALAVHPVWLHT